MTISEVGEDNLVSRITQYLEISDEVLVGPGDDCAVVDIDPNSQWVQLLKTDCIVESVHFLPGTNPERVGWKAICRVLSDFAAMGGEPLHAVITIAVDPDRLVDEIEGWYRGMQKAASHFGGFSIVGGETTSLPDRGALISVAMTGRARRNCYFTRKLARPGDLIAVTGQLGNSFHSEHHLDFYPRLKEAKWLVSRPEDQRPTAMMDLSDGLGKDLARMAGMSGQLSFQIDSEALPRRDGASIQSALGEGEDYELLMTLPKQTSEHLLEDWHQHFPNLGLSVIGQLLPANEESSQLPCGWDHFA